MAENFLGMSDIRFNQLGNPINDAAQITPQYRIASEAKLTGWDSKKEVEFQNGIRETPWFKDWVIENGHPPNLSPEQNDYNYRAAWQNGVRPSFYKGDGKQHWGSVSPKGESLKAVNHPTAWKEDYMQITDGKDPDDPSYRPTAEQTAAIQKAIAYRYSGQLPDTLNDFKHLVPANTKGRN